MPLPARLTLHIGRCVPPHLVALWVVVCVCHVDQDYLRTETYAAANPPLIDAQADRALIAQRAAEQRLVIGEGHLDGGDGVVLVRRRGQVERVLVLRPVVPAPGQPPRAPSSGLELGEVQFAVVSNVLEQLEDLKD